MIEPQTSIPGSNPLFDDPPLVETLNQDHPLIKIAKKVDWDNLVTSLYQFFNSDIGRPILSIRLMVGLMMLKFMYDLSDAEVVAQWEENIYYQAFTGQIAFVQKAPCHSSQLTLFRQRIKQEGCELIFKESVRVFGKKVLEKNCVADTTVQEANITYPTQFKLIMKAIALIIKIGTFIGIKFRYTFAKEIKHIKSKINFSKSKLKDDDTEKYLSRLREIGNYLLKIFTKKLPEYSKEGYLVKSLLFILNKVINQKREDKNKVYSIHEPQTKCIAKGKSHKKYEFGSKVSLVISKSSKVILGILNFTNNPYDGDTLEPAIEQLSTLHDGYKPKKVTGDRGYRGRREVNGVEVITPYDNKEGLLSSIRKMIKDLLRSRVAIEPIIGHLKADHRLSRNLLKGVLGDNINPLLSATAFNLLKYARTDYNHHAKPPRSLALRIRPKRNKYPGLPLWRPKKNQLFNL
jgi:IS5 family transposase